MGTRENAAAYHRLADRGVDRPWPLPHSRRVPGFRQKSCGETPHATCPPDESLTLAALTTGLVNLDALNAECTVDPDTGATVASASASVDEASLLGGVINITNIQSTCQADADGITRTSRVGTINGIDIGSGSITIPLVATVHFNETTTNAEGQLIQNAIRVQTLLGQQIILASCRLG